MLKKINWGSHFPLPVVCLFFILFLLWAHPTYNSDDDTFFLYALSGGYGMEPTNILHYSFSWHPVVSWPIMQLFKLYPHANWYTTYLLALHLASCIHLVYLLQTIFSKRKTLLIFLVFFLFIEARLLHSLNYSGTSLVLCLSGLSAYIVYHKEAGQRLSFKRLLTPAIFVLAGGMIRPHMLALCVLLALSTAFFLMPIHNYKALLRSLVPPGLLLVLAIAGQLYYYQQCIPEWKESNKYRESLFKLSNHPKEIHKPADSNTLIASSFIERSFIYDTSFVSQTDIDAYTHLNAQAGIGNNHRQRLYWAFMESRVYLLLWGLMLASAYFTGNLRAAGSWLWQCLPPVLIFCCLYFFFKITESIFLALFSSLFFSAVFTGKGIVVKNGIVRNILYLLLFLSCAWMVKRLVDIDTRNWHNIKKSRLAISELNTHKDFLFISSDNHFPHKLSIWDAPAYYPLHNLINKELALTRLHKEILYRYNIIELPTALLLRQDVFLTGNSLPLLKEYYRNRKKMEVEVTKVKGFTSLNAYQVKLKQSNP